MPSAIQGSAFTGPMIGIELSLAAGHLRFDMFLTKALLPKYRFIFFY
jgi:hypothetical protein